jgi:hypothetical protein
MRFFLSNAVVLKTPSGNVFKIGDVDEHKVSDAACAVYERMRGEYRPLSENTGFLPL